MKFSRMMVGFSLVVLSKFCMCQVSQSSIKPQEVDRQYSLPTTTLNLADGKPLLGLPSAAVMGSPMVCSPDGNTFIEVYADTKNPVNLFPNIYKISTSGEVKRLDRRVPTDYQRLFLRSSFAGEHMIVSLIDASGKKTSSSDPLKSEADFISIIDLDGGSAKLIELDLKFQPLRVAILPSGKFVVLGLDTVNIVPVLALLNEDATLLKSIDLDNRKYDSSRELRDTYNVKGNDNDTAKRKQNLLGALISASFTPYGSKVLLVQPGTNLPIHILGESGDEGMVSISLPSNYLIQNILGSEKTNTWIVRAQKIDSFQKMANEHVVMNPEQQLFEVDSGTQKAIRILETPGVPAMMVTCAADKKLTAVYNNAPPGASADVDRFVLAMAPR
jgi:hypothetical protein